MALRADFQMTAQDLHPQSVFREKTSFFGKMIFDSGQSLESDPSVFIPFQQEKISTCLNPSFLPRRDNPDRFFYIRTDRNAGNDLFCNFYTTWNPRKNTVTCS